MINHLSSKELFKEKSLWDVIISSQKFKSSIFDYTFISVSATIAIVQASLYPTTGKLLESTVEISKYWLPIGLSTLGFLISGVAIFMAIGKPEFLLTMAKISHTTYKQVSHLKYVLFAFVRVLAIYTFTCIFCAFIVFFFDKFSIIPFLLDHFRANTISKSIIIGPANVILICSILWCMLSLKSFIFNIYSSVLACIKWESGDRT